MTDATVTTTKSTSVTRTFSFLQEGLVRVVVDGKPTTYAIRSGTNLGAGPGYTVSRMDLGNMELVSYYLVPHWHSKSGTSYSCSCPDSERRRRRCKHVDLLMAVLARLGG